MKKTYTNFLIKWQNIQMQWSYFTLQTRFYALTLMHNTWLNQKHAVALRYIFPREHTFKMCGGVPGWPNTCKLQNFKICCHFCCRRKTVGCFVTVRDFIILRNTSEEICHPQTITQVCTENKTDAGIANDIIKQQRSRAINMPYFGIRDQKTLNISHCTEIITRKACRLFYKKSFCKTQ